MGDNNPTFSTIVGATFDSFHVGSAASDGGFSKWTREQQAAIEQLLKEDNPLVVEPPFENGSLEVRRNGKHHCFIDPDGSIIP